MTHSGTYAHPPGLYTSSGAEHVCVGYAALPKATEFNRTRSLLLTKLLLYFRDVLGPLSGHELVARKVRAVMWQGGWYPLRHGCPGARNTDGSRCVAARGNAAANEFNWGCGRRWYDPAHCEGESAYAVLHMPSSIEQIFSEVGGEIGTGGADVLACAGEGSPCRQAFKRTLEAWRQDPSRGRASWDPVVTLMAVRGIDSIPGAFRVRGTNLVAFNGTNYCAPPPPPTISHNVHAAKGSLTPVPI